MSETFLYEVVPHRPIRGLVSGKAITRPMVLLLDREDVIECLKKASVYRRFTVNQRERVTLKTVDRFHRKEFISAESFEKLQKYNASKKEEEKSVEEEVVESPVEEAPIEEEVTESVEEMEETVEETSVEEEIIDDSDEGKELEEELIEAESTATEEVAEEKKEDAEPSGSDEPVAPPVAAPQNQRSKSKAKARRR